jgi:hypothetical protein
MAEFLVRVTDKVNADPYLDCQCTKRGDVIVVQEDGWAWGSGELTNPHWRIVQAPNITVSAATAFLGPELAIDPQNPSKMLQRRGFKLDLTLLPAQWAGWVADDTRAQPTKLFNGTGAQVLALKAKKPVLVDPNVMG